MRLDGPVADVLVNGTTARTVPCAAACQAPAARSPRRTAEPPRLPDPLTVTSQVSVRGTIMIGGQRIQVLPHAGQDR